MRHHAYRDPVAVRIAFEAGQGAKLQMRIGGKVGPMSGDPLDLDRMVKGAKHDLVMTGLGGAPVAMGDSVLAEANGVDILLTTRRNQAIGIDAFTQLGCELLSKRVVVVKSSQHFYASFSSIARKVIYMGTPGTITVDPSTLPYDNIRRPK